MADPRLSRDTRTVNEELQERAIRHSVYLTRYSSETANKVREAMRRAIPDLEAKLERTGGQVTAQRLQSLIATLSDDIDALTAAGREATEAQLGAFAVNEAQFSAGMVQAAAPVTLDLTTPEPNQLKAAALSRPFQGRDLRDWYGKLADDQKRAMRKAVQQAVVQQETVQQLTQRIRGTKAAGYKDGIMGMATRNAESIGRTAVIHTSEYARRETMRQNSNVVKDRQWVATLDTKTCPICQGKDGTTIGIEGQGPPAHIGCRCSTAPVLKSWDEIGIDAKEISGATRASMDGQVPESMTYGDWLRSRVQQGDMDVVEEALGPKRAKLFSAGGINVTEFTDRRGEVLNLEQLRAKEPEAFEQLNL